MSYLMYQLKKQKMKRVNIILLISLLLAISSISCAQSRYAKDQFDVDSFTAIKSSAVVNIKIRQSSQTEVTAEGNADMLDLLKVRNENNTLILEMEKKRFKIFNTKADKLTIYINTPTLTHIDVEGVGNIEFEGNFDTPRLTVKSEGTGNLRANNLSTNYLEIDSEGVGNIRLAGRADEIDIKSEGVGNINLKNMHSKVATVDSEGIGNISCHSTEYLRAKSEGIGNITYYGNPKETIINKEGIGNIKAGR